MTSREARRRTPYTKNAARECTDGTRQNDNVRKVSNVTENNRQQKRSTEGCSKFKSPETRQVQERLVSTLEHMQVPKWDRTRCPEE